MHVDRVNQNQGAESTLAFLISLCEMELLEQDMKAFRKPTVDAGLKIPSVAKAQ